jgi:2-amino-4-hydroxy-6-hydroxymethyldihydropteridine diphosphokinase
MDTSMHTVFIGVGSNLGDKRENCLNGISRLTSDDHSRLVNRSPLYQTEPVDYLDQDWFVNCVIQIETHLEPVELLKELQRIQKEAGRIQDLVRFGPRILDMDILLFDDLVLTLPDLEIPHPRTHLRRFVLKPLCDLNPELRHPVLGRTFQQLLEDLTEEGQGIIEIA